MDIKTTIQKAIEGGWKVFNKGPIDIQTNTWPMIGAYENGIYKMWPLHTALCDPDFWECLGKAMGWKYASAITWAKRNKNQERIIVDDWKIEMHNFIDHLAEGGSIVDYFEKL